MSDCKKLKIERSREGTQSFVGDLSIVEGDDRKLGERFQPAEALALDLGPAEVQPSQLCDKSFFARRPARNR